MTRRTWKQALRFATEREDYISIGGGEPTLHPDFWEIIGKLIGTVKEGYVWLATNGSMTETSIALAGLAKKGVIGCALSQDCFHDPINPKVVEAFTKDKRKYSQFDNQTPDAREIRDVSAKLIKAGRCMDSEEGCICEDVCIDVSGAIRGCGCADAPVFGDIWAPKIPVDWDCGACSKRQS